MMFWVAVGMVTSLPNGFGLTCGPESTTETCQVARQPPTVKLSRVRRATVGGDKSTDERKAARFKPELAMPVCKSQQSIILAGHVLAIATQPAKFLLLDVQRGAATNALGVLALVTTAHAYILINYEGLKKTIRARR